MAQRLATVTEYVYARLTPVLGKGLGRKTHVVVTDEIDDYNGFAGVTPYPAVTLYANSPDDRAELNDYDDWLTDLFMHEYTHVIHTGTIGGWIVPTVNALLGLGLGIVWSPNQLQPRWGLEGLAVFEETARTAAGRLRNAIWDMYLRAQTLEGKFQRIDQVSATPIQFPFGNSAYLYGSALMRYVAEHFGESVLLRWSRDYGAPGVRHDILPGALNRSIRRVTGKTWLQLYADFKAELTRKYTAQRDAIVAQGVTSTHMVAAAAAVVAGAAGVHARRARAHRAVVGRLLAAAHGAGGHRRAGAAGERHQDQVGGDRAADGCGRRPVAERRWATARLSRAAGGADQLLLQRPLPLRPRGAREAAPDRGARALESGAVARRQAGGVRGHQELVARPRADARRHGPTATTPMELLIPVANMEHVYTPSWSPDGKTLAFSWWRTQRAARHLHDGSGDADDHARSPTIARYDLEPRFSPDGKWLYFVSRSHRRVQPLRLRVRHQEGVAVHQRRRRRVRSGHLARRQDGGVRRLPRRGLHRGDGGARSVDVARGGAADARSRPTCRRRRGSRTGRRTGTTRSARSIRSPGSRTPRPTATARSSASSSRARTWSGGTPGACSSASAPRAPTTCSSRRTIRTAGCGRR